MCTTVKRFLGDFEVMYSRFDMSLGFGIFFTHGTLVPTMSVIWTFPARHNILPGARVCKVVLEAQDAFSPPHQD